MGKGRKERRESEKEWERKGIRGRNFVSKRGDGAEGTGSRKLWSKEEEKEEAKR